jgi:O-antigen/teichoic acid export membrane protein
MGSVAEPGDIQAETAAVVLAGSARRRVALVTLDQGLSGASNLLVLVVAAHVLAPIDFGRFALILLIYAFSLSPTRAVISLPAVVHPEDADHRPWEVLGSALVLAVVGGTLSLMIGGGLVVAGSSMGPTALALGVLLPQLTLHDVARYLAIARSRPVGAILLDSTWLILMAGGFAATVVLDLADSLLPLILVWGGSGAIASLWIFRQYGFPKRGDISLHWLRERWHFSGRNLVANLSANGGGLVAASLITLASSPIAVAAVRASQLLCGPMAAAQTAISTSIAADVAREGATHRTHLVRHQKRALTISVTLALVNLGVFVWLPGWAGKLLLGNVWPLLEPLMLAVGLTTVAMAVGSGIRAVLLGRRQIQLTMRADIAGAMLTIGAVVIGAVRWDAAGAVWGLVVGRALVTAVVWFAYWHFLSTQHDPDDALPDGSGQPSLLNQSRSDS